ncbi:MAG: 1-acyl-sn-glycerol-3-phosphate acyltransferase [Clostridia bacterium]|nr:1-acyl-sn-glycerol-3-phosphate acyltransferase [Clostridia bacterium]
MKIKIIEKSYDEVMALPKEKHKKPHRPDIFFRTLMRLFSIPDLKKTSFSLERRGMEQLSKGDAALYLVNHSSFIDLEIVATVLYPRPFNIVTTTDGFIGKNWLMRMIGCIPTKKFVNDLSLVHDMSYALHENKSSVILFPEAGYSFDGTAGALPESLGKCVKLLKVPVVMLKTFGAYHRDPLYNNLQRRKVKVSAVEEFFLSREDIEAMSCDEINDRIRAEFSFDSFAWQKENGIKVDQPFRADYLNRVLYKCPHCLKEGKMRGEGVELKCEACGNGYELDEYGYLKALDGETKFDHVPAWYNWQRECVRREIEEKKYKIDIPVDICMTVNTKHLYHVGEGNLLHTGEGFKLTGCDGALDYEQKPLASYTLNSDFNWYEIGDVISIGNSKALFYCFPKIAGDIVAKARLAAEELFKKLSAELHLKSKECGVMEHCDKKCGK